MAIESQYRELFSEQVTVIPPVSVDKYGRRVSASAGSVIPAHLVAQVQLTRTPDGREVLETGRVYLYGAYEDIDTDYLIVLPDGSSPVIVGVNTPHDPDGAHHTVVRVGK